MILLFVDRMVQPALHSAWTATILLNGEFIRHRQAAWHRLQLLQRARSLDFLEASSDTNLVETARSLRSGFARAADRAVRSLGTA